MLNIYKPYTPGGLVDKHPPWSSFFPSRIDTAMSRSPNYEFYQTFITNMRISLAVPSVAVTSVVVNMFPKDVVQVLYSFIDDKVYLQLQK